MEVIPAIDLLGSEAVRLERGDYERIVWRAPAAEHARALAAMRPPLLHVVDLDGARSGAIRVDALRGLIDAVAPVPVQASGGVRTVAAAEGLLAAGATRVVVGTAAFTGGLLDEFVAALGDRLVVAVDVRDGRVAVGGWLVQTAIPVAEALERCLAAGVVRILGTAISRDGTLGGPDLELMRQMFDSGLRVLAAGGIRDAADVAALERAGCEGAIVGRAYTAAGAAAGVTSGREGEIRTPDLTVPNRAL